MKKFIALVLSLVMALSLCVPAWGVAVDEITAEELQVMIDEAVSGSTISLNNQKVVVSSGEATISAPGKTVTIETPVEDVFTVTGGTLTLGEGIVVESSSSVIWVENGGQVIVDGAEITTTCTTMCVVAVWNTGGSFTLESGSIIAYGDANVASGICAYGANSKVTINNGEVKATSSSAAFACGGAEIIVNDGSLTVTNAAASNALIASATYGGTGGKVTVKGGTVQGVKAHEHKDSTAVIEDGNITGSVSTANGATLSITGGTFVNEPADTYVADGYEVFAIDEGGYLVAVPCSVTFDANGGKNELKQHPVPAGQFTLPTEHPFTREGYTFKGWATDKDATEVLGATYDVTGAVTFYAIWEKIAPPADTEDVVKDEVVKGKDTTIEFETGMKETFESADADDISTEVSIAEATATDLDSAVIDKIENEVEKELGSDAKIVSYLDIDVKVFVNTVHVGNATVLPEDEAVTVCIPADVVATFNFGEVPTGYTRHYYVIRFHNGVAEKLDAEMVNGELVFESHLFSTYAVVYEDTPVYYGWGGGYVGGTTTTPDADETVTSPDTFDAGVVLYVGMSVAAAVGTVTLSKKRED